MQKLYIEWERYHCDSVVKSRKILINTVTQLSCKLKEIMSLTPITSAPNCRSTVLELQCVFDID